MNSAGNDSVAGLVHGRLWPHGMAVAESLRRAEPLHLHSLTPIAPRLSSGILLLFLGRKLFWLFVAAIGFVVGAEAATTMFPQHSEWVLIFGLVLGLVGALVALLVQKVAIGVGGFLAGGYFLMIMLRTWALQPPEYTWVAFLVGGCIGALLMFFVFDWALILFSSISGAHLIHPRAGFASHGSFRSFHRSRDHRHRRARSAPGLCATEAV